MTIPAPKVMLVGATGTGKTHAIRTLLEVKPDLEVFIIFTEPGQEVLGDTDPKRVHWKYISPASTDWASMIDSATKINTLSFEALTKLGDINKRKYIEFITLLQTLSNFTDERTGQNYGAVDSWGTDRVLVIDSLSGINVMAMNLVTGTKPVKSQADWGVAQSNLEQLITNLTTGLRCGFVLTAHLEREMDEITGGVQLMASTLGKKLAPKIPRFFSDVVMCRREGAAFTWSTATMNVDLKARNLPIADNQKPSFTTIYDSWVKRGGAITKTETAK